MYTSSPTPTQIQQYRIQNPAMFQRSDEDIASMIKNQSATPSYARTATQQPPSAFQQLKDQAKGAATNYAIKEGATAGLDAAGLGSVDAAGESTTAADVGGYLAAAKGLYNGAKVLGSNATPEQKIAGLNIIGQDTGAGIATGGLYNIGKFAGDKLTGGEFSKLQAKGNDKLDSLVGAVATPVTFGANKLVEKGLSLFGSGKGQGQMRRDQIRKMLQQNKFLDEGFDMTLDDGSKYDLGRDGGAKDESGRGMLELDFSNSKPGDLQGVAIGNVNPLAAIITGGDKKLTADFATYFTKGTMSNAGTDPAKVRANAIKQYSNAGLDKDKAIAAIADLEKQGKIGTDEATAYKNGISMLFGGGGSPKQASQGNRGATSSSSQASSPKPKRRPSSSGDANIIPVQAPTPTTLSPNSTVGYGDNFAQNLANIYSQNQG
jgi:hypothetical protein